MKNLYQYILLLLLPCSAIAGLQSDDAFNRLLYKPKSNQPYQAPAYPHLPTNRSVTGTGKVHYQIFKLTHDMAVPGSVHNDPNTQGIRLIGLNLKRKPSQKEYQNVQDYQVMVDNFDVNGKKRVHFQGKSYHVVGDIFMADDLSNNDRWNKGQSRIIEEYYELLDSDGNRTGIGLRYTRWNRSLLTKVL